MAALFSCHDFKKKATILNSTKPGELNCWCHPGAFWFKLDDTISYTIIERAYSVSRNSITGFMFLLLSIFTLFVVSLLFSFPWQGTVDFIVFIIVAIISYCGFYSVFIILFLWSWWSTIYFILSLLFAFSDGYCGFYSVFITLYDGYCRFYAVFIILFPWWVLWILCCLYYSLSMMGNVDFMLPLLFSFYDRVLWTQKL